METISPVTRDLLAIGAVSVISSAWFLIEPGTTRNIVIVGATTALVVLLWGIRSVNKQTATHKPAQPTQQPTPQSNTPINPHDSLEDCLRYYRIVNHPASEVLRDRVNDYRNIVIKMAQERAGKGTMWRDPDPDVRVRACLCGELTRDELIKAVGLQIAETEPPKVGAGMGIAPVLAGESRTRGSILAEDGYPATRVLVDPVVDNAIATLVSHRPEASAALSSVRHRYMENILRRLIGPLDDRGRAVVPLCKWKKRFDGDYYVDFERLEKEFMN